jgi:hypothetical protein
MSIVDAKGRSASRREPSGGYEGISVTQLSMVWWAYQSRLISKLGLRAYFGCWELETRRRLSGGKYQPSLAGLQKLVGGPLKEGKAGLRPVVDRLLVLGLLSTCSKEGISFASSPEDIRHEDKSGLEAMLEEMRGVTRKVPVPRRIIRRLAGGLSKARTAVVIAHLIRCLFYRKAEGINPVGCCKASWIADAFGITERSVYDARSYLALELGWLIPQDNSQRILNRDGLWVTVNLDWGHEAKAVPASEPLAPELSTEKGRGEAPSENESSGPQAEIAGHFSGPIENKNPLTGSNNQKPASGGPAGVQVSKSGSEKPTLRDVVPEDLRDTARLLELHEQAVEQKLVTTSEADRLKFVAGAEHAKAVGSKPCKLFAWIAWKGRWEFITQADEDAARVRLKQHFHAPPPRPTMPAQVTRPERTSLSEDAVLVQTITAALKRANHRGDGFPLLKRERPEWTRERWDAALAELESARFRRIEAPQGITTIGSLVGRLDFP